MATKLKSGDTLLLIGDSITDHGRRAEQKPLGGGYAKLVTDLITAHEPAKKITFINRGIGGNKAHDLQQRWTDDCLRYRPNWLTIMIGINDLHNWLANDMAEFSPKGYAAAYDDILLRTKKKLPRCRITLLDPFYLSQDKAPGSHRRKVLETLPQYHKVVKKMVRKYKTGYVATHDIFQKQLKHHPVETFCSEPVHPNITGHIIMAQALYEALCR